LGNALTFAVQLPSVLKLLPDFQLFFDWKSPSVRQVMHNFGPIFFSRGVVQVSAFIDSMIASWLPTSAVAAFGYAQIISVLPVSLFSMSVSAAELPALSSAVGSEEEVAELLRKRLTAALRKIAFFIVPSAVAFLVLGDVLAAALYQSGKFKHDDAVYLWGILAGSSVGLLATSLGRLYSSTFYALLDTRTPLRFAVIRVVLTSLLGLLFALEVPKWLGVEQKWGVAGLTASAGIAGWLEFALLRRALTQRIGNVSLDAGFTAKLWAVAFGAALVGYALKSALGVGHPVLLAGVVVSVYGIAYFAGTFYLGISEAAMTVRPLLRRFGLAK
jgi:putative peptidoglycan lipid II flippase